MPMERQSANSVYSTWWHFRQSEVLETVPAPLQRFFIYALQRCGPEELDPLKALETDLRPWRRLVWDMDRNMWCTASFLHAAGRNVERVQDAHATGGAAVPPAAGASWTAKQAAPANAKAAELFTFVPARVEVDASGKTKFEAGAPNSNMQLFKVLSPENYGPALRDCLRGLFQSMPLDGAADAARSGQR